MPPAAALTELHSPEQLVHSLNFSLPEVVIVPEMLTDEQTRLRAARFIGAAVLGAAAEIDGPNVQSPIESLHEAIHLAAEGNVTARQLVETNVKTDVIERTIKTGHVMTPVPLIITDEGKIIQHGQSMDSVQANSLRYAADHPVMRERTEAETRNAFRIEELNRAGMFDDYCFVVISRAENLPEAGFFTDTMSCSIQVTAKQGEGLATESAFVSGIAKAGEPQHDATTVVAVGERFDVDLAGKSAAQIIDTPLLIRKDLMPNGAVDIVKIYDDCAGGTFFGEAKPKQDYLEYLDKCRRREQTFVPKVEIITHELLDSEKSINSPIQAVEKLHELSEKHMVEKAIMDASIDARVFGGVAAVHIEQARAAVINGDWHSYDQHTQKAKNTAQSSSCPSGKTKTFDGLETDDTSDESSSDDDCEFISKECPVCHKKNVKTLSTKTHIEGDCGCKVKK